MLKGDCTICSSKDVTVYKHHIQYSDNTTIVVCPKCHSKIHSGKINEFIPLDNSGYSIIRLSKQNRNKLNEDRKDFERLIGGGKWSLNDAFSEYLKILRCFEDSQKNKKAKK